MTDGPKVMLGTKCPSITSRWIQSAPAASTASISSPSRLKSEARTDAAILSGRDMSRAYTSLPRTSMGRAGAAPIGAASP